MSTLQNRQVKLAARPVGMVKATDFVVETEAVRPLEDGEVLVRVIYISLDPAMRGWLNEGGSYTEPVKIGAVMTAGGVGKVVESKDPSLKPGDWVNGMFGVQEYAVEQGKWLRKIDVEAAPPTAYLGVLGMPGVTAYFGILEIGAIQEGDTVVVSGATGAVGQVVGQIAKIKGCRTIGIAGGPEKCAMAVSDYGYDVCIDYKNEDVRARLREEAPKGLNVYVDNVGGEILEAALANLAMRARIAICGAISQYNNTTPVKGPSNYMNLLIKRSRMEGFLVSDFWSRQADAIRDMAGWIGEGKLKHREDVEGKGVEDFVEVLNMLFTGGNKGKLVLRAAPEDA